MIIMLNMYFYNIIQFETSALTGNNVAFAFESLIRKIREVKAPKGSNTCCDCCCIS